MYHKAPLSSNARALVINGPDEDGVVKNGVVKYNTSTPYTGIYGVKRPDGKISIHIVKGVREDAPEVTDEMREEIYDKLLDYEGPAPMEYNGPTRMQDPVRYDHVNRGGPENNDGDATFGEGLSKSVFQRIKEFLSGSSDEG